MNKNSKKTAILNGLEDDLSKVQVTQNHFPTDVFPLELQLIINEVDDTLRILPEYFASAILYTVSVALSNNVKVRMQETWDVSSSLYIAIIGRTGDAKSQALSLALKPLYDIDSQNFDLFKKELKEFENSNGEMDTIPVYRQLLLNDCTTEALIKALSDNPHGVGIFYDELRGLINSFNKYRNGNDLELYLSLWSGKPINKNRASGELVLLHSVKVSIIGTLQEKMISSTFSGDILNNGFIERFLFTIPTEKRDIKWSERNINIEYLKAYYNLINNIYNFSNKITETHLIDFEKDAKKCLLKWQNVLSTEYDFEYERALDVKLQEYTIRFALIIQIIQDIKNQNDVKSISIESVEKAIKLYEYFKYNALKVRELYRKDYVETLTENQKRAHDLLPSKFITSQAIELLTTNGVMKERSVYHFLKDKKLFKRLQRGYYEKKII